MSDVGLGSEWIFIDQATLERVDEECNQCDIRQEEFNYLDSHNPPLSLVIKEMLQTAMGLRGQEAGMQSLAGALFSSRLMRYALDAAGASMPSITYDQYMNTRLNRVTRSLSPVNHAPTDYSGFEAEFASQVPLLSRLSRFRYPYSRLGATATIMLHDDVFAGAGEPATIELPQQARAAAQPVPGLG